MIPLLLAVCVAVQEPPPPEGALARMGSVRLRHYGGVRSVFFSPDGSRVLSVGSDFAAGRIFDKTLRVWDAATGRELRFLNGDDNVALSPDRSLLVSWTMGRPALRLRETATGKPAGSLSGPPEFLGFTPAGVPIGQEPDGESVAIFELTTRKDLCRIPAADWTSSAPNNTRERDTAVSPDGRELARVVGHEAVSVLDLGSGRERLRLKGHNQWIDQIRFSPDGEILATGSGDSTVGLWDLKSGTKLRALPHREGTARTLFFSPDGAKICTTDDRRVYLWEVSSGRELSVVKGSTAALSKDGRTIAFGLGTGPIEIRDLATLELRRELKGEGSVALAFSPDGKTLASAEGSRVELWNLETGAHRFPREGHAGRVEDVAFSPDGRTLATAGWDASVRLWTPEGTPLATLRQGSTGIERLAFSPDGKTLVSGAHFGELVWWDPAAGRKLRTAEAEHGAIFQLAFSPDGEVLATADQRSIQLWGSDGRRLRGLPGSSCVALSRDGARYAAELHESSDLLIGELAAGRRLQRLIGHDRPLRFVSFYPEGRRLLSVDCDHTVLVWDLDRESPIRRYDERCAAVLSPDGALLGLGDEAGTVRVCDAATGEELLEFRGHGHEITALHFSPEGRRLASASADGTALVWDLSSRGSAPQDAWGDLARRDGLQAHRAISALAATPEVALPLLKKALSTGPAGPIDRLPGLLKDLDDDAPAVRERALRELALDDRPASLETMRGAAKIGTPEFRERLEAILQQHAAPAPESPELLRRSRAIRILEWIGSPGAREILEGVANGSTSPRERREALAALKRLPPR